MPRIKEVNPINAPDVPGKEKETRQQGVYVACAGSNCVNVVDVKSMKAVTHIPVSQVPKRNITAVLP